MALILVVDGDSLLCEALQRHFQRQGYQVILAHEPREAVGLAERYCPDAIVLNAVLPQSSAAEAYERLKAMPDLRQTPVLCYNLTLRLEENPDAVRWSSDVLAAGSSSLSDLAARAEALLQRDRPQLTPASTRHLIAGRLALHAHNLTVTSDGRVSRLTPTEFALLRYLMLHIDEACSSRRLLENVWGYPPATGSTDVVRTHIMNLRHKIEENPAHPTRLRTVRNCGYVLCSTAWDESGKEAETDQELAQENRLLRYAVTAAPSSARLHRAE